MFLLNSCLGLFTATSFEAPLLPKLRGHFAEFLNNTSLVDLRILSLSTCVGFRYGRKQIYSGFSWQLLPVLPYFSFRSFFAFPFWELFLSPQVLHFYQFFLSWLTLCFCVPTVLFLCGAGISTCSPSTTLLSLALGPDSPRADQLYSGTLGYSV